MMNEQAQRPTPVTLRQAANEARNPIVAQALRDLAAEYERIEALNAKFA